MVEVTSGTVVEDTSAGTVVAGTVVAGYTVLWANEIVPQARPTR